MDGIGGWAGRPHTLNINILESCLGYLSLDGLNGWSASDDWVAGVRLGVLSPNPDVWMDGSLVRDDVAGVCCGGSGVFAFTSGSNWFSLSWGHLELLPLDRNSGTERSWLYFSLPRPLQTVQRAELWGLLLPYKLLGLFTLVLTTLTLLDMWVELLL